MRLSTIALSLIALGVATSVSAAESVQEQAGLAARADVAGASRDFERKMQVRSSKNHHSKKSRAESLITNGMLTWYGGGQLSAPACGGPTPSSQDHVVAVKQGGQFQCGDEVHLHHGGKMVKATVVDYCAGCDDNHVDATQGVFTELASLDVGELHDMHIRIIPH